MLALGNGFRLPGFQKFLEQNLNTPVVRLDGYSRLRTAGPADTPVFTENLMSFAVAYGLAIQGLGLAPVQTNLLPAEITRKRRWDAKRPWFAAAAAVLLAIFACPLWRASADRSALEQGTDFQRAQQIAGNLQRLSQQKASYSNQGNREAADANRLYGLWGYHNLVPAVLNLVDRCIAENAKDQPVFADSEAERRAAISKLYKIKPRSIRRIVTVEALEISYLPDIRAAMPGLPANEPASRGLRVLLKARTPLGEGQAASEIVAPIIRESNRIAVASIGSMASPISVKLLLPVRYVSPAPPAAAAGGGAAAGGAGGAAAERKAEKPDPTIAWATSSEDKIVEDPDEDMARDTRFEITWILSIANDGLPPLSIGVPTEVKGK